MAQELFTIREPDQPLPPKYVPLALGFRPFFLLAGVMAVALVAVWIGVFTKGWPIGGRFGAAGWHAHEMIFGYTVAVIAGFLLTAVRNWTGRPTPTGAGLGVLAVLWLLGRVAVAVPQAPLWLISTLDLAFLPVLAATLAVPLVADGNWRNIKFVPILLALAAGNLLMHLQLWGVAGTATRGAVLGLDLVVLVIATVGGRVIPFFTRRRLEGAMSRVPAPVERLAEVVTVVWVVAHQVVGPWSSAWWFGVVALALALIHGVRLAGWMDRRVVTVSLLWVLFAGYGWLVVGFACAALRHFGWASIPPQSAWHAFGTGAIGVLTLGMMARVALGHSGRVLKAPRGLPTAFVLVNLAAVLRVFGPSLEPVLGGAHALWMTAAGTAWAVAFAIFTVRYFPVLMQRRVDGRPG